MHLNVLVGDDLDRAVCPRDKVNIHSVGPGPARVVDYGASAQGVAARRGPRVKVQVSRDTSRVAICMKPAVGQFRKSRPRIS